MRMTQPSSWEYQEACVDPTSNGSELEGKLIGGTGAFVHVFPSHVCSTLKDHVKDREERHAKNIESREPDDISMNSEHRFLLPSSTGGSSTATITNLRRGNTRHLLVEFFSVP